MSGSYGPLAGCYDELTYDVDYPRWADYIEKHFARRHIPGRTVLDLACGTGSLTRELALRGYEMIGVDRSEEMLAVAAQKAAEEGLDILYLEQDMQSFELYGTVRAAVCVCDSLNYLLGEEQLRETFRLVNNYLDPGGVFLFDFNTVYKYEKILGDVTIAENREDCAFIWENFYDEETRINEYDLTFFVREKDGAQGGLFRRFLETHCQRGYELSEIRALLEEGGLRFEEALDADTLGEVTPESGRIYCIAREQGK